MRRTSPTGRLTEDVHLEGFSRRVAVLATLAVVLAAGSAGAQSREPYDIDVTLPLSGYGAFLGNAQAQTLSVVERYVNDTGGIRGRPLHFVELDSQSNPTVDLQLTAGMLAKHPAAVIDGGPATVCRAVAAQYAHGPVMACLSPAFAPEHGNYGFPSGIASRLGMQATLRYLQTAGYQRIGVITVTDIAGQEADAALKAQLADPANHSLNVVAWEHFGAGDISADAQLAKIKEANPQVVIGWATGTPMGTLLRGAKDAGITVPFVASEANQTWEQMQQYKAILPREYILYSAIWPEYASLPNGPLKASMTPYFRYMTAAGLHPDGSTPLAWDSALLLVGGLRKLGPEATADQLHAYLADLHDFYGPSGSFDFRAGEASGLTVSQCIMVRWNPAASTWQPVSGRGGTALAPRGAS
jgi:branched-chain amino acid transport system substrate-binding protein